ncbi:MAG TPA: ABC transporter permease [Rhizomicrobium sp.]|jgi:putative ABC transport system permease protein|nr:ABC transporter permease [Rhizomicrobium sp.]
MGQIAALCLWNIRTIAARWRGALVVVVGFFGVVIVFAAVLSIRDGLERSLSAPGSDAVAVTYARIGSLGPDAVAAVETTPGIARTNGAADIAPTLVTSVVISDWKPGLFATAVLRGVAPRCFAMLPGFRITQGRMFRPGMGEVIAGTGAERLYPDLGVGRVLHWNRHDWKIVGAYATGDNSNSQFLTDLHQLQAANNAGDVYTEIFARLASPAAFPAFKRTLEHRAGLALTVETLVQRDRDFGATLNGLLLLTDAVITVLMAVGAIFGALNVMYANVASRRAELATLRALGFSRLSILLAVLMESILLALVGGGLGILAAYLAFNGFEASTEAGSLVSFQFLVTLRAVILALILAVTMGLLGGLLPSIRAARLPLAKALRDA